MTKKVKQKSTTSHSVLHSVLKRPSRLVRGRPGPLLLLQHSTAPSPQPCQPVSRDSRSTSQTGKTAIAMVLLSRCTESCGWVAAILAALSWGSFGVPIKGDAASTVNVDPLVMQSYKTIMCFLTCWLVIPLGEPFSFTPWGIVSGTFCSLLSVVMWCLRSVFS